MDSPVLPTHAVVWRSTTVECGAPCVMTSGLPQTLVWLAVNLDFLLPVPAGPQVVLEGVYFLIREVHYDDHKLFNTLLWLIQLKKVRSLLSHSHCPDYFTKMHAKTV